MSNSMLRGTALFFGAFWTLCGVASLAGAENLTIWSFDVRPAPRVFGDVLILLGGVTLLCQAFVLLSGVWSRVGMVVLTVLAGVALADSLRFAMLVSSGAVRPGVPVPLSALVAIGLIVAVSRQVSHKSSSQLRMAGHREGEGRLGGWVGVAVVAVAWMLLFPLGQMLFFGGTDYRRQADAIVVLGARAYANGRPSDALRDRVTTAVGLYRAELAPRLVFSGGPGDGSVHEAESMRRLAVSLGVPDEAILEDRDGLNTTATARNTVALARDAGWSKVLIVSHAYHLPRTKLACNEAGLQAYTVPAHEARMLTKMPWLIARETAAWWVYMGKAIVGR